MKKFAVVFAIAVICCSVSKAQYVNLPDSNFRVFLQFYYPTCFNSSGQIDTTCPAILNEDSLSISNDIFSLQGIHYFKNLRYLNCSNNSRLNSIPKLPENLRYFEGSGLYNLSSLPALPATLESLNMSESGISGLPALPASLQLLNISNCYFLTSIPALPFSLKYLYCHATAITTIPSLPPGLTDLICNGTIITSLPSLPFGLSKLDCSGCLLTSLPELPSTIVYMDCSHNSISIMPALPTNLKNLYCGYNSFSVLPALPEGLTELNCPFMNGTTGSVFSLPDLPGTLINLICYQSSMETLPQLPNGIKNIYCSGNRLTSLPDLPDSLLVFDCRVNRIHVIPTLPSGLIYLNCGYNPITNLPPLPISLQGLSCENDSLIILPSLPKGMFFLNCSYNQLTTLPPLPDSLNNLDCSFNDIYCLPRLPIPRVPDFLNPVPPVIMYPQITFDAAKIKCIPNQSLFRLEGVDSLNQSVYNIPLCNPTNNSNQCESFPVMQGTVFFDNNNNGIKDGGEPVKNDVRINLSNNSYSFSNNNGQYEIGADSIGNYNLTATAPRYFSYAPVAYNYNFTTYDTLVTGNFALQADTIVDELTIHITPINRAARPGFAFPYMISYENTGTTALSPTITFDYDETRLTYNSSSAIGVTDNTSALSLNVGSLFPGQSGSFTSYFNLKTTAVIGDSLKANATMNAGIYETTDVNSLLISGSFDPNDKQATPQLSPSQVASGKYIDYTIRFQNTGTDTAFNIVISDTLSEALQTNALQMITASHTCKATVKDNIVFFEFLNILLPDSNVNEPKSHGFVSFRIKPQPTVAANFTITNKAAIYFDYNAPVITNTVGTLIKEFTVVPLRLVSFSAVPQTDNTTTLYWNTTNEINTKQFTIEKSSDGSKFNAVSNVTAKGNVNNDYSANVMDANNNLIYYRLKIVDNDGSFVYSSIIKIDKRKNAHGFSILSNPAKDFLVISTTGRGLNNTQASIINTQGAVVKVFTIKEGTQTVDIHDLPHGLYYLRTLTASSRIVIQ